MAATMEAFERFVETGRMMDVPAEDEKLSHQQELQVVHIATKTGLEALTVEDLLRKGWIYREELGKVPVWVHPMEHMLNRPLLRKDL